MTLALRFTTRLMLPARTMALTMALTIAVCALFALSCAGDEGTSGCSVGSFEACSCGDGSPSQRVCTDKRAWSPCVCSEPDAGAQPDVITDTKSPDQDIASPEYAQDLQTEPLDIPDGDGAETDGMDDDADIPEDGGPEDLEPELACVPNCAGRACGDDGCDGSCGDCDCGHDCVAYACNFTACDGRACGLDGAACGLSCGGCYAFAQSSCKVTGSTSACTCQADCEGRSCGNDGCGGSCGVCTNGLCNADGICTPNCVPDCSGLACGAAPCDTFCGICPAGETCTGDNRCVDCLGNDDCPEGEICDAEACRPIF
jgi:hypothetical protein